MKQFEMANYRDHDKFKTWLEHCRVAQMPYIIVRTKSTRCTVEWDHISLDSDCDKRLIGINDQLKESMIDAFKKFADKSSEYETTNLTFFAHKIPAENAEAFAIQPFDYLQEVLMG